MATKAGFSVIAYGSTSSYNLKVNQDGVGNSLRELPSDKLVIAVGNSKEIWPHLQPLLVKTQHPFHEYAEQVAYSLVEALKEDSQDDLEICFTNCPDRSKLVCFSRLPQAMLHGEGSLCYFEKNMHLLHNAKFGTWHAWRFALVFN